MSERQMNELKDYTSEEIENILKNADASKLDFEELELVLKIYVIQTINFKTNTKEITAKSRNLIEKFYNEFLDLAKDSLDTDVYRECIELVRDYISLAVLINNIDKEQGITVGDYDRNIWRATYLLKSIQMAELQKEQGLPVDDKEHLLENQTKNTLKSFEQTTNRILSNYRKTQSVGNLMLFFADYTQIYDFKYLALRFALDLNLREILESESDRVKELILNKHREVARAKYANKEITPELSEQLDKDADELFKKYKPLLLIPNLEEIKVPKQAYNKVRNKYIDLSLNEVVKQYKSIQMDFYEEVLNEEVKGAMVNDE